MRRGFKQSGAKAIGSFEHSFNRSLLGLTITYTAILAAILFLSGTITYSAFSSRVQRRFPTTEHHFMMPDEMPKPEDVRADLVYSVILVDGILLVSASILGYALAKITLKPIKYAYEKQGRFLSDASHELRTPLSVLQIDLENQINKTSGKEKEQAISNLEEVKRMGTLVNDLLVLSKLDEHKITGQLRPIELHILIRSILSSLESLAAQNQVKIIFSPTQPELIVISDEKLLSSALTNLVQNAIIYNKPNGTVELKTISNNKEASIYIIDTGIGIPKKDLQNVFERFYRVDQSRSRNTGGSGLGLSIVRASLQRLNGTVAIESEPDKGTIVKVTLPAQKNS